MNEVVLAVLSEPGEHQRVVLVHRQAFGDQRIVLRNESFSEDVGWFEQSSVEISPTQLGQLKQALGLVPGTKIRPGTGGSRRFAVAGLSTECG